MFSQGLASKIEFLINLLPFLHEFTQPVRVYSDLSIHYLPRKVFGKQFHSRLSLQDLFWYSLVHHGVVSCHVQFHPGYAKLRVLQIGRLILQFLESYHIKYSYLVVKNVENYKGNNSAIYRINAMHPQYP
jgi:hypothetical protein